MKKFIRQYFLIHKHVLTAMLVLLLIPVFLQVVSRFVGFIPRYIWTEELARFAFVWIIMLGSSIAVRDGSHFQVDMLPKLGSKSERVLKILLLSLMILMACVFLIAGFRFMQFGATQHSEIAGLPMISLYIAWPLAGFSWLLFLGEKLYDHFEREQHIAEQ